MLQALLAVRQLCAISYSSVESCNITILHVFVARESQSFECPHLQPLRDQFSDLFRPTTTDMRSFFSQRDKVGVIKFTLNALGLMT